MNRSRRAGVCIVVGAAVASTGCGMTTDRVTTADDASASGGHSSGAAGNRAAAGGAGSSTPSGSGGLGKPHGPDGAAKDAGEASASGGSRDASPNDGSSLPSEAASLADGRVLGCHSDAGPVEMSTRVVISTNDQDVGKVSYYAALGNAVGPGGNVFDLAAGPDGNVWFTTSGTVTPLGAPNPKDDATCEGNFVGRMTPAGVVTRFWLPRRNGRTLSPAFIVAGPDGHLWLTVGGDEIIRMSTSGDITEFAMPSLGGTPWQIVSGSDGNLWFTEQSSDKIGRITPSGVATEFSAGPSIDARSSDPLYNALVVHRAITAGPGGKIRYTVIMQGDGSASTGIGELAIDGGVGDAIAITRSPGWIPASLASDLAGNVWFNEFVTPIIGRLDPSGGIREFAAACLKDGSVPGYTDVRGLVASSPAGDIWFTRPEDAGIDRRDAAGVTTCYVANGPAGSALGLSYASRIAAGTKGDLWFAETVVTLVLRTFDERALYIGHLTP